MVGTQQLQNPKDGTPTTKKEQWQIHYSRFFNFPSLPSSTCPTLQPRKKDNACGFCLSASSVASVQLIIDQNARGMFLTVTFKGKIYESLKNIRNVELAGNKLGSDVSPPSKFFSSSGIHERAAEKLSNASPVGIRECPIQSLSNIGSLQYSS